MKIEISKLHMYECIHTEALEIYVEKPKVILSHIVKIHGINDCALISFISEKPL